MDRNINYHIIFEYFYIGYQYWSYSNKEKFFVKSFITLVITSFISIYHPYNYDVSGWNVYARSFINKFSVVR
jgi:hypothetical protein